MDLVPAVSTGYHTKLHLILRKVIKSKMIFKNGISQRTKRGLTP